MHWHASTQHESGYANHDMDEVFHSFVEVISRRLPWPKEKGRSGAPPGWP